MTLTRSSRVVEAYAELKTRILDGRIAPGFQASEPEIATLLGMSRTPVREAMVSLEAEGMIELIPRRGARVVALSMEDIREIYELLAILEPQATARLAVDPDRAEKCAGIVAAVDGMEAALDADDLEAWAVADDQFHRELLTHQGNARLEAFARRLYDQSTRIRVMTLRLRQQPRRSTQEHRETVGHILNGNAEEARRTFRLHRERTAEELLGLLDHYKLIS